jgi:hypothetical protein
MDSPFDACMQDASNCVLVEMPSGYLFLATTANLFTCQARDKKLVDDILALLDAYATEPELEGD